MFILDQKWQKASFQGLSAIFGNLSAGFYGTIIIYSSLSFPIVTVDLILMVFNFIFGTLLLLITVYFERKLI